MKRLLYISGCLLFLSLHYGFKENETEFQTRRRRARVVLQGEIEENNDFFKRKIFKGKVVNRARTRADFVQLEFTMFNKEDKIVGRQSIFVNGSRYVFGDSTVSNSSLKWPSV